MAVLTRVRSPTSVSLAFAILIALTAPSLRVSDTNAHVMRRGRWSSVVPTLISSRWREVWKLWRWSVHHMRWRRRPLEVRWVEIRVEMLSDRVGVVDPSTPTRARAILVAAILSEGSPAEVSAGVPRPTTRLVNVVLVQGRRRQLDSSK
jgi:hypothetical protein